ncbi:MAG: hypothetical protein AAB267_03085 [Candidatus Desantisbacteria bacterium]
MKLIRMGNIILNMEQLLAVRDNGDEMVVFFAGSSSSEVPSITFVGKSCQLVRAWLGRNGVNDLSTETPKFDWDLISAK